MREQRVTASTKEAFYGEDRLSLNSAFTILLVEDNEDHILLIERAFKHGNDLARTDVIIVEDGEKAMDFLYHRREYLDPNRAPRPDLILLDIKMPKMNGIEVLHQLKHDDDLRSIPVVMLTSSRREEDILDCYEAGANSYITKPPNFHGFIKTIKTLKSYWLKTTRLPV
ncbi:response regulator [bacterium]|nr:response regulator [candidate division CSSED10-310 bacterium]